MSMFSGGELDRFFYRRGISLMLAIFALGVTVGAVAMWVLS